jgi:pimeloyl-ACP methyl ester carboxylesterase
MQARLPAAVHEGIETMLRVMIAILLAACVPALAQAQQRVAPVLVLIPGYGGAQPDDFLIMSMGLFNAAGFQTDVVASAWQASSTIAQRKAEGAKVTLVGMSYGAVTAAEALAAGARPDAVVFAGAGLLPPGTPNGSVQGALGTPAILPRTLVLHARADACRMTPPQDAAPFVAWTGGRARARLIDGAGGDGHPCRYNSPHTFTGRTRAAADAIIQFAPKR